MEKFYKQFAIVIWPVAASLVQWLVSGAAWDGAASTDKSRWHPARDGEAVRGRGVPAVLRSVAAAHSPGHVHPEACCIGFAKARSSSDITQQIRVSIVDSNAPPDAAQR
jgi:hypothetical protein